MILLFERIKYRQALNEYKNIVMSIDKLTFALLQDLASPNQFNANEENIELMLLSGILDLNDLLCRYEENPLALLSTSVSFSSYHKNVKIFSELLRMKASVQFDSLHLSMVESASLMADLDEVINQSANTFKNKTANHREETLRKMIMKHAELLRCISSIRSAIRSESIDVSVDADIIKKRHTPRKERKQMDIKIHQINDEEKNKKE